MTMFRTIQKNFRSDRQVWQTRDKSSDKDRLDDATDPTSSAEFDKNPRRDRSVEPKERKRQTARRANSDKVHPSDPPERASSRRRASSCRRSSSRQPSPSRKRTPSRRRSRSRQPSPSRQRSPSRNRSPSRRRTSSRRRSSSRHQAPSRELKRGESKYSTPLRARERYDGREGMSEYIQSLGLPQALSSKVYEMFDACASRLFILENSSFMQAKDSHLLKIARSRSSRMEHIERIDRKDNVSRWSELAECVGFHAKMAMRCWIPTKFWLVNDPNLNGSEPRLSRCFSVGWGSQKSLESDLTNAKHIMTSLKLDQPVNSLTKQIRRVEQGIEPRASQLKKDGQYIAVVICTQGIPTDEQGNNGRNGRRTSSSSAAIHEFQQALFSISKLPVKLIFRLCTDDEQVQDLFKSIDAKLDSCDVLDDLWGEALEVYLHNPWLTYGIGLHRLREAGLGSDLMDDLDERPLKTDEIHRFCKEMFLGRRCKKGEELPPPRNWRAFMSRLESLLKREKPQWNPVKKKLTSWIDLAKLEAMHGPKAQVPRNSFSQRFTPQQEQQQRPQQSHNNRRGSSDPPPQHNNSQQRRSTHPTNGMRQPPSSPPASEMTLDQILQSWSHQPPNFRVAVPLENLLVTVPNLFPPTNPKVEPHEYFSKWKEFSKEAFSGSGDELNELLKRAVRKAKFFLHPDKLPQDLTEDQSKLIKYIWDTIQEEEERCLN